jgi:hypothetical protein
MAVNLPEEMQREDSSAGKRSNRRLFCPLYGGPTAPRCTHPGGDSRNSQDVEDVAESGRERRGKNPSKPFCAQGQGEKFKPGVKLKP